MKGEFSNGLTPAQLERLAFLSEELGEAQQAIGKIVRHGYDSYNPLVLTNSNNREDLEKEIGNVFAAVQMLDDRGDITQAYIDRYKEAKLESVKKWLHHQ